MHKTKTAPDVVSILAKSNLYEHFSMRLRFIRTNELECSPDLYFAAGCLDIHATSERVKSGSDLCVEFLSIWDSAEIDIRVDCKEKCTRMKDIACC